MDGIKKLLANKKVFIGLFSTLVICFILILFFLNIFAIFENKLLDFRFLYFNQNKPVSDDIVYIDIDEESLENMEPLFGGWPWRRGELVAQYILDFVLMANPDIFLFDVLYTELSPKAMNDPISLEDDWLIQSTLMGGNRVSHGVLFANDPSKETPDVLPDKSANNFEIKVNDEKSTINFSELNTVIHPFDELFKNNLQNHSVTHKEDIDGISRKYKLLVKYEGKYYPSLALVGIQRKMNITEYELIGTNLILKDKNGKKTTIKLDKDGNYQINFYKDWRKFSSHSADNIIVSAGEFYSGNLDKMLVKLEELKGKIIVIGASAAALFDLKVSPMGSGYPGPFMHITTMSNVLMDQHLIRIPNFVAVLIIIFSTLLIVITTTYFKSRYIKNIFGLGFILLHIIAGLLMFKFFGIVLEMATTLITLIISYFGSLVYLSLTEEAEKRKISNAMSKYLAPSVMEEVLENYTELMGEVGEKKELAILFSDIRSFTTISENYPPETVVWLLNKYLARMITIIFDCYGTVDKFIGDAVMAFWGAPKAHDERDYYAVSAGLKMINELDRFNEEVQQEGDFPVLRIGVGINTGDMIVGNIGSEKRLDYTVIGDNVNLGSRIEGLTKYYKLSLLVSESTYMTTKDKFIYLFVDNVAVKGKVEGIKMYTPLAEVSDSENSIGAIKKEGVLFNKAHKVFFKGEFEQAKELYTEALPSLNKLKGLAGVFLDRCDYYITNPPPKNWNKVWKMLEK